MAPRQVLVFFDNGLGHTVQWNHDRFGTLLYRFAGGMLDSTVDNIAFCQTHHIAHSAADIAWENKYISLDFVRHGGYDVVLVEHIHGQSFPETEAKPWDKKHVFCPNLWKLLKKGWRN